jgi:hypothetical protein
MKGKKTIPDTEDIRDDFIKAGAIKEYAKELRKNIKRMTEGLAKELGRADGNEVIGLVAKMELCDEIVEDIVWLESKMAGEEDEVENIIKAQICCLNQGCGEYCPYAKHDRSECKLKLTEDTKNLLIQLKKKADAYDEMMRDACEEMMRNS